MKTAIAAIIKLNVNAREFIETLLSQGYLDYLSSWFRGNFYLLIVEYTKNCYC